MSPTQLKVTMRLVYFELERRNIPLEIISVDPSLIAYVHNGKQHFLHSTLSEKESALSYAIADSKDLTSSLSKRFGWHHPATMRYGTGDHKAFLEKYAPLAVKPVNGAHGRGISLNITSLEGLDSALEIARSYASKILLQQMVEGEDYRVLCIDGEYIASLKRTPASVVGDGRHDIRELILLENENPERGKNYEKALERIPLEVSEAFLNEHIEDVPAEGETVTVVGVANLSSGGTAQDTTDAISQEMIKCATEVARKLNMGVCGVDLIWDGANKPWLIEINANPGIDMHDDLKFGQYRGAVSKLVDYLLK